MFNKLTDSEVQSSFKIVIIGEAIVGKTTIRLRYLGEGFRKEYLSTLGADFAIKMIDDNKVQIWDLAGQINFKEIRKSYYVGTHGIILVFDVTRKETMTMLNDWIDEFISIQGKLVPIIVIGNKIDLRGISNTNVETKEAIDFIKQLSGKYQQYLDYIETSALTGENIEMAFKSLIDRINEGMKK